MIAHMLNVVRRLLSPALTLVDRYRRLQEMGILGMNRRNARCILELNPRSKFPLVDSKSKMRDLCVKIGVPTPEILAVVPAHSALRKLPTILEGLSDFVLKPNRGAGGRGIMVITGREGSDFKRHNGETIAIDTIRQHVSNIISGLFSLGGSQDEALIQQRVLPHPEFSQLCYQGIGDVRVIVYRNVPAMAMLRLPTKMSGGRANLHQGGIGAGVDLATGITCHAVMRNRVAMRHPDTNASVVGFQVPCWPQILEMAKKVAHEVGLGYIGVDIVLDRDHGPLLLEANARPGLAIQIANGKGLLHRFDEIDKELDRQQKPFGTLEIHRVAELRSVSGYEEIAKSEMTLPYPSVALQHKDATVFPSVPASASRANQAEPPQSQESETTLELSHEP